MDQKERFQKIINYLIKKSFHKLKDNNIKLKVKKIKKGSMRADGYITKFFRITIDPLYKNATNKQISGAIAHELVHFEDYLDMCFIDSLLLFLKYHFYKKFTEKYEKATDKKVIQKGFAKELYANRAFRLKSLSKESKNKNKKIARTYLVPDEIKSYAKRIGRW